MYRWTTSSIVYCNSRPRQLIKSIGEDLCKCSCQSTDFGRLIVLPEQNAPAKDNRHKLLTEWSMIFEDQTESSIQRLNIRSECSDTEQVWRFTNRTQRNWSGGLRKAMKWPSLGCLANLNLMKQNLLKTTKFTLRRLKNNYADIIDWLL